MARRGYTSVTIEIPNEAHELLVAVARAHDQGPEAADVVDVLEELVDRIRDGISRPGSWERQHAEALLAIYFPPERWDLEPVPGAGWRRRLKGSAR